MKNNLRLLRITTVPISLKVLLNGQLPFFQKNGFEVLAVSASGPEVEYIKAEGVRHWAVGLTRKITPIRDFLSLLQMIIVMMRFRPHIVHTHTPKAGLIGMMAAWLCRIPVKIHTIAGLPLMEATGFKRNVLVAAEKLTYAFADKIYTNSQGLRLFIQNELRINTPIGMIGKGSSNGINTNYFKPTHELHMHAQSLRQKYGCSDSDVVFSFVGRIVRDKGISEMVSAFRTIQQENPSRRFRLLLVGSFEQHINPIHPDELIFLQRNPHVILAGFQADVRPWIMASDVFVFPSYREGFPNVVMQACCLEVPCIVSDINGCNEIIAHQSTGLIVPVKDSKTLAAAMLDLANDKQQQRKFAQKAKKFVVENFETQFVWQELLKEYVKLLTAKGYPKAS